MTSRHAHDLGLAHDLPRMVAGERAWGRRGLLGVMGGLGVAAVTGCGSDEPAPTGSSPATTSEGAPPPTEGRGGGAGLDVADGEIPAETGGPFPGDGSNGPNVLTEAGVVRRDLTRSFGPASGVADGVPAVVRLRVYDLNGDEASPLAGAAIYLWHCDREGRYSLYSEGVTEENYLRGVQEAGADGRLEFATIFPACYPGRWPHMHFEVYESLAGATRAGGRLRTSQLALPPDVCEEVYADARGYEQSASHLSQLSLDTDSVFADGHSLQLARVTGSVDEGYTVTLNVPV